MRHQECVKDRKLKGSRWPGTEHLPNGVPVRYLSPPGGMGTFLGTAKSLSFLVLTSDKMESLIAGDPWFLGGRFYCLNLL